MSFSTFSKDFTANMYTNVENRFITNYLPWADGDAVRVYLYGLYLCSCSGEFDAENAAKLLKLSYDRLVEIFGFWEECDLVHILSRKPLFVEYLPVSSAVGKPKPIRPEKYSEFNRELLRLLQQANTDFKPYEMQRILEFLENEPMEPQAFLLIAEYCIKKDSSPSAQHMINKAKKFCKAQIYTFEQVEKEFSDFNRHESELQKLFSLLNLYKKPQESDYAYLEKWSSQGMETGAVRACAAALGKGTLASLDLLVSELLEKGVRTSSEASAFLTRRQELLETVYAVARKLGVKIQNPRAYIETYAEKWSEHGYDRESLLLAASLAFKLRYDFSGLDALLDTLYAEGIVDSMSMKNYCTVREKQLRLLQSLQAVCGTVNKTQSALDMIATWQSWNFSDAMILEAAKHSASAGAPLSYMNKLLSEWKRLGIFSVAQIPEKTPRAPSSPSPDFKSEAAVAADKRTEREHYYAVLRQRAASAAERARTRAEQDEKFCLADSAVKKSEIELAKAEVFSPDSAQLIREKLGLQKKARTDALKRLGLTDSDLLPKYACPKCSDTGFLPDGKICDCYPLK